MDPSVAPPQTSNYFYDVTGQVKLGDNKKDPMFNMEGMRFPIATRGWVLDTAGGWEEQKGESSPLYDATNQVYSPTSAPGVVQPAFARGKSTPTAANM